MSEHIFLIIYFPFTFWSHIIMNNFVQQRSLIIVDIVMFNK